MVKAKFEAEPGPGNCLSPGDTFPRQARP
ncbi:hypothetical protein A2U01_0075389 [Trifolium medium]|uniref:Uncharacterized protein n=1 Tax=Trifolium medium TaxID=97028 RepID=A0A392SZ58_9FABA|nr:hypothetical protein [Trifolium medium]